MDGKLLYEFNEEFFFDSEILLTDKLIDKLSEINNFILREKL